VWLSVLVAVIADRNSMRAMVSWFFFDPHAAAVSPIGARAGTAGNNIYLILFTDNHKAWIIRRW
jgi:hypothetical protein